MQTSILHIQPALLTKFPTTPSESVSSAAMDAMQVTAIVAAAGMGTRLGANKPKALVEMAGAPLLVHAIRGLHEAGVKQIVVTIPNQAGTQTDAQAEFHDVLRGSGILDTVLVPGGRTRQESVAKGIAAVTANFPDTTHVLVHDAARALTPASVITRVIGLLAAGFPAVIPVLPVVDTIKEIELDAPSAAELTGENPEVGDKPELAAAATVDMAGAGGVPLAYTEKVVCTVERGALRAVQTPQGFDLAVLRAAHEAGAQLSHDEQASAPDDAALVELNGGTVYTVPGDARAMKITTPFDMQVAQMLAASSL
ncbi:MAG: 2-C-methyl-D-erythritol 4-phosphate cytidylyltransferase [Actinomycetaceae bacterium]|nr:2-C-methyl-D-erythritol 4-phosphate cytidylyltransferase [Actinomycetaceae bacterium]MDY5273497.1 2-C-methyl-D-erythritol 4-phosphate cytidylyltransferase [Arcanobacterium sp.]